MGKASLSDPEWRGGYYDRARRVTPFLATRAGGGTLLVHTEDRHVGRSLFSKQGRGEIAVLGRAVAIVSALKGLDAVAGRVFLDVGANIGTTTVPALIEHGFARALAFEPEPQNVLTLRLNAVLNGLDDRMIAVQAAVSNTSGVTTLVVNLEQGGKHWVADEAATPPAGTGSTLMQVRSVTLDELVADGTIDADDVGLLWIDAQAHEGQILEGAGALTHRGVSVVLEWDPRALDRAGNRSKVQEIAARDYTHFADLRQNHSGEGPRFELRPCADLPRYADKFLDPSRAETFTDVLLLRLSADQLPEEHDLAVIIKNQVRAMQRTAEEARAASDAIAGEPDHGSAGAAPASGAHSPAKFAARRQAKARARADRQKEERAELKQARSALKSQRAEDRVSRAKTKLERAARTGLTGPSRPPE